MSKVITVNCIHHTEFSKGSWTHNRYWPVGETVVEVLDQDEDDAVDRSKIGLKTYAHILEDSKPTEFSPTYRGGIPADNKDPKAKPEFEPIRIPAKFVVVDGGNMPTPKISAEDESKALKIKVAELEAMVRMLAESQKAKK